MEIYSRFHGSEKKLQQHDDYGIFLTAKVRNWDILLFMWKNDVIWCYITLNYMGFMLINSI